MVGLFATSLAGHDKNRIYLIIEETGEYVLLADGECRKAVHPKKKKTKHIQPIHTRCEASLLEKLSNHETIYDEEIKRAITQYRRSICQRQM